MTSKRTLLRRDRRDAITGEMVELYATGREIIARGDGERWEEQGGRRRAEFLRISKRLEWSLLKRAPHEVSVFDDLDGEPPGYMQARNSAAHPDFNGWYTGRELQRRLQAALNERRR